MRFNPLFLLPEQKIRAEFCVLRAFFAGETESSAFASFIPFSYHKDRA